MTQPLSQTADLPSQMISYDYRGLDADFQVPQRLASSASQPCGLCVLIWSQNLPLNTFYLLLSPTMSDQVHHKPEARNAKSKRSQILQLLTYCLNTVSCSCEPGFSNNVPPALHYLPPLNPKSVEFMNLFQSFLSSNDERKTILELPEPDAKVFIEIVDRVCSLECSWRLFIDSAPEHEGVPSFTTENRTSKYRPRRSQKVMWQDRAPS